MSEPMVMHPEIDETDLRAIYIECERLRALHKIPASHVGPLVGRNRQSYNTVHSKISGVSRNGSLVMALKFLNGLRNYKPEDGHEFRSTRGRPFGVRNRATENDALCALKRLLLQAEYDLKNVSERKRNIAEQEDSLVREIARVKKAIKCLEQG